MSGRVTVVGLGPGRADWCSPAVRARLREATDLVGYERYLALVDDTAGVALTGRRHGSDNRVEPDRARVALDLAVQGGDVVVVSSGDAGVFAMASVVLEQIDTDPNRWRDVIVDVEPGITAASALAARVGAPLGHDFCVISLSDILKPWELIERRLDAAAAADFVIALYNPRSRHRPHQFAQAIAVITRHRGTATPVVVGRHVGRPGEKIEVTTLAALDPDSIDMSTLAIVGSSTTRVIDRATGPMVYTPRNHPGTSVIATDSAHAPQGLWLLTGGARSGKSSHAETLAGRHDGPVTFIATAEPFDDEMAERIRVHREQRPIGWTTIESPLDLPAAVARVPDDECLVIDCLTVWVGNVFHHSGDDACIVLDDAVAELVGRLGRRAGPCVVVTNEVGLGLVPDTALGRRYRDALGRVNAAVAAAADRVLLMSAGRGIELQRLA